MSYQASAGGCTGRSNAWHPWGATLWVRLLCGLWTGGLLCSQAVAVADYYYYGVACDDFLDDNDILWNALKDFPEWKNVSPDLADNRYGKIPGGDRDSIYEDLQWYASKLKDGDVFLFMYAGHGGWDAPDGNGDEGSTARPTVNDPAPPTSPPYAGDEFFGRNGGYYMTDDDFVSAFSSYPSGVEVMLISGACHSGGWVGGSSDLNTSKPASSRGLFAVLDVPEQGLGTGLKYPSDQYYSILLTRALAATAKGYMTASQWYNAAVAYGAQQQAWVKMPWDNQAKPYWWWPEPGAELDRTWKDDHWGWQETYLQLTPVAYNSLDAAHDRPIFTPEPGTLVLAVAGFVALSLARRRGRPEAEA
ncbi:MAG: caspase family protein [Armatimonadetes bacterium]|nr:caspase family protein [Armatimonadota bacterium]